MNLIPKTDSKKPANNIISPQAPEITISGLTEMFRDPGIFQLIRTQILPYLETFLSIKVWHIGCSTGEEAYSMAMLLKQAALLDKATLFATDKYQHRILQAKSGRYAASKFPQYAENFYKSGLKGSFENYLIRNSSYLQLMPEINSSVNFFQHDIQAEASINSFSCIFCRNVLIYYSPQEKVKILKKILESLEPMGFLILGHVEDLRFSPLNKYLKPLAKNLPIYQKVSR